jgi:hypothetical protein
MEPKLRRPFDPLLSIARGVLTPARDGEGSVSPLKGMGLRSTVFIGQCVRKSRRPSRYMVDRWSIPFLQRNYQAIQGAEKDILVLAVLSRLTDHIRAPSTKAAGLRSETHILSDMVRWAKRASKIIIINF